VKLKTVRAYLAVVYAVAIWVALFFSPFACTTCDFRAPRQDAVHTDHRGTPGCAITMSRNATSCRDGAANSGDGQLPYFHVLHGSGACRRGSLLCVPVESERLRKIKQNKLMDAFAYFGPRGGSQFESSALPSFRLGSFSLSVSVFLGYLV
jgi:hypothetical protein